jgi:hypothetical protein
VSLGERGVLSNAAQLDGLDGKGEAGAVAKSGDAIGTADVEDRVTEGGLGVEASDWAVLGALLTIEGVSAF